jgi:4-hydroxybutyrate CoA-transferase
MIFIVERSIGHNVAALIPDGACLQVGIGNIPNAVLKSLEHHRNLGVHSEMFSDNIIPLINSGVINNMNKQFMQGHSVTSFVVGSKKLYDFVDDNPGVYFYDVATVNSPRIIGRNEKVMAINAAVEIDITGQVCADSIGTKIVSGVGGQVDFERGAALSKGGIPMICLPSTVSFEGKDGQVHIQSRIVPTLKEGAGVVTYIRIVSRLSSFLTLFD